MKTVYARAMAVSTILGIFMPMSMAVDASCDYYQEMEMGQEYYIYSPGYPNPYKAGTSCRWVAHSPGNTKIVLSCDDIDIPKSNNCVGDRISVSLSGDPEFGDSRNYCGKGTLSLVSSTNSLVVGLFATWYSSGGKFLCTVTSIPSDEQTTTSTTPSPPSCDCGWKQQRRIVGGEETGINEFPAMAALINVVLRDLYCGASIISSRYALTVAHCARPVEEIGLLVGDHDITTGNDTAAAALYAISDFIVHPDYVADTLENDVAVVKTVKEILFSRDVGPICLPFKYASQDFTGSDVTALGWGTTEFSGPKSDTLQAVNLTVIDTSQCQGDLPENAISNKQICTYAPGKDACQSDSGGPLYYFQRDIGRLLQVGVISYGLACATSRPGVNVRVSSYLVWIVSVTSDANYCIK